jgi:hypothetical protein
MKFWSISNLTLTLIAIFYIASLFILTATGFGHNSPDEHAAFLFTNKIAQGELPVFLESRNLDFAGIIHPRSTFAFADRIVPIAFLGLPIVYGSLGYLFGSWIFYTLTPVILLASALALFELSRAYFNSRRMGFIVTAVYLFHPAVWFYAGRSLMHNVPFNSFLIISAYLLWLQPFTKNKWLNPTLAGISFSLALQFRLFEAFWVIPLFGLASYLVLQKNNLLKQIVTFVIAGIVSALPFFILQHELYGAWYLTGYNPINYDFTPLEVATKKVPLETSTAVDTSSILPFGFHPRAALRHTWLYLLQLFPWLTITALIGLFVWMTDSVNRKKHLIFLPLSALAAAYLTIIYGSWTFNDNPDPRAITIANSYIRYWLPLFTLSTFLIASGIDSVSKLFGKKENLFVVVIIALFATLSISAVFSGPDGLLTTRRNLLMYDADRRVILENTSESSIVIVDFADKYLYPHRSVIVPLRNSRTYEALPILLESEDIYYFGITLPEQDLNYLRDNILNGQISVSPITSIREKSLYRLELK